MNHRYILLLCLFTLSGFTGLIYESIWTHYLKLYLGHAAYAQTLVLAIFMGGMAIGAALCSYYSYKWKNLILLYALMEGIIGLCALGFHNVFSFLMPLFYDNLQQIETTGIIYGLKWFSAALLILPQSIILGATFPLLSAGILRNFPQPSGAALANLYFLNSLGGAVGVLVSGFLLIKWVGLPGTLLTAGLINIVIAMIIWLLYRGLPQTEVQAIPVSESVATSEGHWKKLLLLTALITGLASFVYEIAWIRMLSLVLGSSSHAFELMLSAFIFGLAFGGMWIRKRIDHLHNPIKILAVVQIVMGVFAVLTLYFYNQTFDLMKFFMTSLNRNDNGYLLFNLFSHSICFIIMLPATFCAGMTLPLITYCLLKKGFGEKSIGAVYSVNTLGAIIGIFICVHLSMWYLGLKGSILFAAALDMAMGIILFSALVQNQWRLLPKAVPAALVFFIFSMFAADFNAYKMMSGVYRFGRIMQQSPQTEVLYHAHGKTSTVDLVRHHETISLTNNGKSDATISINEQHTLDEVTQTLLALLPMMHVEQPKQAAVVGMGLGMTSHLLLSNSSFAAVNTIEIERAIPEAAAIIRPNNELVFSDQRSHIHIEDAKTFFSSDNTQYDIIVSEPSNPWVSGIASLFSTEFYHLVAKKLNAKGVFSQWVQIYEIDDNLVASILKAMNPHFADIQIYMIHEGDMVVLASKTALPKADYKILTNPGIKKQLQKVKISSAEDIQYRFAGGKKVVQSFMAQYPIPLNSDYFPVLDQLAVRSRFLRSQAHDLYSVTQEKLPIISVLEHNSRSPGKKDGLYHIAQDYYQYIMDDKPVSRSDNLVYAEGLKLFTSNCAAVKSTQIFWDSIFNVGMHTVDRLSSFESQILWKRIKGVSCYPTLSSAEKDLIQLFSLQADARYAEAVNLAKGLLNSKKGSSEQTYYLLKSVLLGMIQKKHYTEAKDFWLQFAKQEKLVPGSSLRLLLSYLGKQTTSPAIVQN